MKKALALVLALVLALSMAVNAFAADLITLQPVSTATSTIKIYDDINLTDGTDGELMVQSYEGGVFYKAIDLAVYKDVTVSATGAISAKIIDFDPAKMVWYDASGATLVDNKLTYEVVYDNGKEYLDKATFTGKLGVINWDQAVTNDKGLTYAAATERAAEINKNNEITNFVVLAEQKYAIIEITVEDNFTASYKEGSFTVKATKIDDKKAYSTTINVVNDVVIFGYEAVKAAANGKALYALDGTYYGYSDYETYKAGYKNANLLPVMTELGPVVVSTTEFRAIAGDKLTVVAEDMTVVIKEVAAAQKGVNFLAYAPVKLNKAGVSTDALKALVANGSLVKAETDLNVASIDFGFYGNQKIASDFTITLKPGYTWFSLREAFLEKVEEDDIISFYLLKDGKLCKEYKIDYMTINPLDEVKLEIEGKAGETLGQYSIVLEVPASESAAEESNPNTGAESVVGVVAALAVVSLASAAAVSLKK